MDDLLPLLPTLVQLARTGSVSQTARELGVPRSTVSRRLTRLESTLGVKLAVRSTHRFRLTPAGRKLVESAVGALAQLQTAREQVISSSGEVRGLLRVAMPPGLSGAFIGWFLAFLHARHPAIDVELVVTERRPHRLEEGFDVVLVLGAPESSPFIRRRLTQARLMAVASPAYLKARGTPKSVEALASHVLLTTLTPGGAPSWPRLKGPAVPISPRVTTNNLWTLREAALAGIGIAMIPFHVVMADLTDDALVPVLPQVVGQAVDVFALYLPERRASPVLKAVLAAVSEFSERELARVR